MKQIKDVCIDRTTSIRQAMAQVGRGCRGIALVVDTDGRLEAALTDGDLRRAILAGIELDAAISCVIAQKQAAGAPPAVTARQGITEEAAAQAMREAEVRQLPLLDDEGRVVDLLTLDELLPEARLPVQTVIMAGGFGTRLRPLTDDTPKPMLSIAGRPLLERMIERLRLSGIHQINVTTHYMPEKITEHFGDGQRFGVNINYVAEDEPLGTAGALGLVGASEEPLLVLNGDILTQVDFADMLAFHREMEAEMTIGVAQYDFEVPYGVIEADGGIVRALREKPRYDFQINAGMYLIEPSARRRIPPGQRCDMTDLIAQLLADGQIVASFPVVEYWLDIGKHSDFQRAQQEVRQMRWAS